LSNSTSFTNPGFITNWKGKTLKTQSRLEEHACYSNQ
jgi:hypothetical protein